MTAIVISIDNHTTIVDTKMIPELNILIERDDVHFDESPFGNFQQLQPGEYWSDEIIKDRPINEKFDIKNYIKRQWEKWDNYCPVDEVKPAHVRYKEGKCVMEFLKFNNIKELVPKSTVIPKKKPLLP